jgi:photosystem II stability/assembly factor-like uncharacterized protein
VFRKTLLILALAAAPALAAQQPTQQPTQQPKTAKPKAAADTTKTMAHRRHARKVKPATAAAAPRDTTRRP